MKLLHLFVGCIFALASCCSDTSETLSTTEKVEMPEIKWHNAKYSLQDYSDMQPGRPILAIFTADWNLVCALQRKFLEGSQSKDILRDSGYLCLWYDMTHKNPLGRAELDRLDVSSLPFALVINGPEGEEKIYSVGYKEEEVHSFLRSIRTTKYAEQAAAPNRL